MILTGRILLVRSALLACVAASSISAAYGQTTETPPAEDQTTTEGESAEAVGEDIVVTGTRRSLEDALATKRRSVDLIDSLSSEGVGRLPDLNLAESLQRVPGVQISRNSERRLGTVALRGLPGDFAQTLLNGQYLASGDVTNFSFGTVRSEVFGGIDVIKSQSAASITGGLSGLVNLRTGSPMEALDGISLSADANYEELTEKFTPGGAIVINQKLIPGVLAVRAAVGYRGNNFRVDRAQINSYDRISGASTVDDADDVFAPRQIRLPFERVEGRSISASAAVDWRPTETVKAEIFGFYNDYTGDSYQSQFLIEALPTSGGVGSSRILVGEAVSDGAFGSNFQSVRIENPQVVVDTRQLDEAFRTHAITGKLEFDNETWRAAATIHQTQADRDRIFTGFNAIVAPRAGGNGFSADVNTGGGDISRFTFDLTPGAAQLVNLQQPFSPLIAPGFREQRAVADPSRRFLGLGRDEFEMDRELAVQLDLERQFNHSLIRSVAAGAVYRAKHQAQRQGVMTLLGTRLSEINNSAYDNPVLAQGASFANGRLGSFDPADYGELDVRELTRLVLPVDLALADAQIAAAGSAANPALYVDPAESGFISFLDAAAIANRYVNDQKIYGGYGQLNLDGELTGNLKLRGNLGIRYERTERSTVPGLSASPFSLSYGNWLPLANFVLDVGSRIVLRTSYSHTLRRPQPDQFAVLRSISTNATGQDVTVNLGAANLRAFRSENFDASFEFYNRPGSSISIQGFFKHVTDFAGTTRPCFEDGGDLGLGPLSLSSGICRTTTPIAASAGRVAIPVGATVNINVFANQDSFNLYGFEASVQQNLDFLPAPWNGFGGQLNYTNVNVDYASGSSFRISELSRHTVNAILYYETDKFSVRGAYNWRSGYFLASAGSTFGAERFVAARPQLDLTGSFNVNDRFSLNFEAFNITDEVLYEFEGQESRPRLYTVFGRTFTFGVRYRI